MPEVLAAVETIRVPIAVFARSALKDSTVLGAVLEKLIRTKPSPRAGLPS